MGVGNWLFSPKIYTFQGGFNLIESENFLKVRIERIPRTVNFPHTQCCSFPGLIVVWGLIPPLPV